MGCREVTEKATEFVRLCHRLFHLRQVLTCDGLPKKEHVTALVMV